MPRISALLVAVNMTACSFAQYTVEEQALVMRPDACVNPEVTAKPIWCPKPKNTDALPVETINMSRGTFIHGRLIP